MIIVTISIPDPDASVKGYVSESSNLATRRVVENVEVKLYLNHTAENGTLSTGYPRLPPVPQFSVTTMNYTLAGPIGNDLVPLPIGDDLFVEPQKGGGTDFILQLRLQNVGLQVAEITITLYDDLVKVAENPEPFTLLPTGEGSTWNIPLITGTNYTFTKGSYIYLAIKSTSPLNIYYLNGNAHLRMFCNHIVPIPEYFSVTTLGLNKENEWIYMNNFEPNLPEERRVIKIEGVIFDKLGAYDIDNVTIDIEFPDGSTPYSFSAERHAIVLNGYEVKYNYTWGYPGGLPPGDYYAHVTARDKSCNEFTRSKRFSIDQYGVCLMAEDLTKYGVPDEKVTYEITILNSGSKSDTFILSCESDQPDWVATLSGNKLVDNTVSLNGNEYTNIILTVTVPTGATPEDLPCITTVTANSTKDINKFDTMKFTTTPVSKIDFQLLPKQLLQTTIAAGEIAKYDYTLKNTGQVDDSYNIKIPIEPPGDWNAELVGVEKVSPGIEYPKEYTVTLAVGEERLFQLQVIAPQSPVEYYAEVFFVVASETDPNIKANRTTITTIEDADGKYVELTVKEPIQTSEVKDPRSDPPHYTELTYEFTIILVGAWLEPTTVNLMVSTPPNWDVVCDDTVTVEPDTPKSVTMKVTPPSDVEANEDTGYKITIQVTGGEEARWATEDVYAKVEQFYRVDVDIDATEKYIETGGTAVTYTFTIINRGNGGDNVKLYDTGAPSGWKVTFSPSSLIQLAKGDRREITMTVKAPDIVRTGDYAEVTVTIESSGTLDDDVIVPSPITITTTVKKKPIDDLIDLLWDIGIILVLVIAIIVIAIALRMKLRAAR
jgi:uncharacterized membrane protein